MPPSSEYSSVAKQLRDAIVVVDRVQRFRVAVLRLAFVQALEVRELLLAARSQTARSTLRIVSWPTAVTPTFLPAFTSSRIMCEPVNVLPVPGGPWIGSTPWSSSKREADARRAPRGRRRRARRHGRGALPLARAARSAERDDARVAARRGALLGGEPARAVHEPRRTLAAAGRAPRDASPGASTPCAAIQRPISSSTAGFGRGDTMRRTKTRSGRTSAKRPVCSMSIV